MLYNVFCDFRRHISKIIIKYNLVKKGIKYMQKIFIKHYKQIVAIFMAIMLMFVSILTVSPIDV
mgnify:FL=1